MTTAHRAATRLGARPLVEWIEAMARRARVTIDATSASEAPIADIGTLPDAQALTAREHQVLALVANGYTNRRIAETLFNS